MDRNKKIKSFQNAIERFELAADAQTLATESGDFKNGNKLYEQIISAVTYLRNENCLDKLLDFLNHPSVGVRIWTATYLLPSFEYPALKVLEDIAINGGVHAFDAKIILQEWRKGKLILTFNK